jgi:hypothetical protein
MCSVKDRTSASVSIRSNGQPTIPHWKSKFWQTLARCSCGNDAQMLPIQIEVGMEVLSNSQGFIRSANRAQEAGGESRCG